MKYSPVIYYLHNVHAFVQTGKNCQLVNNNSFIENKLITNIGKEHRTMNHSGSLQQ